MTDKALDVYIAKVHAGTLSQDASGSLSFSYLRSYRGVPLSSAMPLSTRTYRDKVVAPYIWGLLPEDPAARRPVALEAGVSPNNPFALLGVIGLDCPGAVQFCKPGEGDVREERLVPMSDEAIARRLAQGRTGEAGWLASSERWSLGGQQAKFALRREAGNWYSCAGAAATTHIFKSGVKGLSHQALNEYVCLQLAAACGIRTATAEYREFEGENGREPAIIIERYDRVLGATHVERVHQEDLCQALGCLPDNKYTMYGGPGASDIVALLLSTGKNAQANVADFLQMLFFNYLLAATDAHAKNYSILLEADGAHRLAPMYDVASIAPYADSAVWGKKPPKLAMSVGGENRVGHMSRKNLKKFASQCALDQVGITAKGCSNLIVAYADMIPRRLAKVFDGLAGTQAESAASELRARMEPPIAQLCASTLARLG